jgi:hypothetical protein
MNFRHVSLLAALALGAACSPGQAPEPVPLPPATPAGTAGAPAAGATAPATAAAMRCEPSPRMQLEGRASPYDSTVVQLGNAQALVCYGRPAARGRTMIGGEAVPYGRLWRTGANEPTILHLPVAAEVAGMRVEPGSYSLYTIPGEQEWTVILNRSTAQWGHESAYTEAVRAQEVGQARVPAQRTPDHVESFTIRSEPAGANRADLLLEWERTRVRIPIAAR